MTEKVPAFTGGVPPGGTTGQALVKASNSDNDVTWGAGGGGGGTVTALFFTATNSGDGYQYSFPLGGSYDATKVFLVFQGAAFIPKQNPTGILYNTAGNTVTFTATNGIPVGNVVHFLLLS